MSITCHISPEICHAQGGEPKLAFVIIMLIMENITTVTMNNPLSDHIEKLPAISFMLVNNLLGR